MTAVTGLTTPSTPNFEYNYLAFIIGRLLEEVQTATLVKVISCTNAGGLAPVGTVVVQPLVFQMTGNRQSVPHDELYSVPYLRIQGGANAIIIDPEPDDIGIAVFCSRDISNIKANPAAAVAAGGATPGSFAQFDWADGLYVGGVLNGLPAQYIAMALGGIKIVSPTKITLQAPEIDLVAPVIALTASTSVTITSPAINLVGAVNQTGGAASSFSGSIDSPSVTSDGTVLHTHEHGPGSYVVGSSPVTGDSGTPI